MMTDSEVMRIGAELWESCRSMGGIEYLPKVIERDVLDDVSHKLHFAFAAKWAEDGFTKIVMPHTYTAALAATSIEPSMGSSFELPWHSMLFVVPDLLNVGERKYDRIAFTFSTTELLLNFKTLSSVRCMFLLYESADRGVLSEQHLKRSAMVCAVGNDWRELVFLREDVSMLNEAPLLPGVLLDEEQKKRAFLVARRIVVGALYTLQCTRDVEVRQSSGGKSKRLGLPPHRNVFLGKPAKIDLRSEIRQFVEGVKGRVPSVQSLVRGHYQRYGHDKRWLWKEPFWRGPEDAEILVRPKVLA